MKIEIWIRKPGQMLEKDWIKLETPDQDIEVYKNAGYKVSMWQEAGGYWTDNIYSLYGITLIGCNNTAKMRLSVDKKHLCEELPSWFWNQWVPSEEFDVKY